LYELTVDRPIVTVDRPIVTVDRPIVTLAVSSRHQEGRPLKPGFYRKHFGA